MCDTMYVRGHVCDTMYVRGHVCCMSAWVWWKGVEVGVCVCDV